MPQIRLSPSAAASSSPLRVLCALAGLSRAYCGAIVGIFLLAALAADAPLAKAQTAQFDYAIASLGGDFITPQGVAVDGAGNVYISDAVNNAVKEMPAGCHSSSCVTTLGGGFSFPAGVAVDGAGKVYISDAANNAVKEMPAGCHSSSCVTTLGGGFSLPTGVAVDGAGKVYISDAANNAVKEMPADCHSSGCVTTLGGGFDNPTGVAVDGAGNVYVADNDNNAVKEMPADCHSSGCVTTLGGGFDYPTGVAVDGAGNVYVADKDNNAVKEMPAGCHSSNCVTTLGGGFNEPIGVAVDSAGNVYVTDEGNSAVKEIMLKSVNFYSEPVGSTSAASTLTFTFTAGGTIKAPAVLTQGAANLDFLDASTGTCTTNGTSHSYSAGDTCTVNVTFKPQYAGTRYGAVELLNSSGAVIATANIYGTGAGPQVAFTPSTQTARGVVFYEPTDVTVDGAGNVYVADSANSTVVEMPAGCASSSCVTTLGGGFRYTQGVAVDGAGKVYVADYGNSAVNEMPAGCASSSCVTALGGGFDNPWGIAVDGVGNVYVADYGNSAVKEMPAGCASSSCVTTLGGGFNEPIGVAVDGAGNVYVADYGHSAVKEMPAGCASSNCVTTLGGGFFIPTGVAVDGAGNVYVADAGGNYVVEINRSTSPDLSYATATPAGMEDSVDRTQTVTIANIGNTTLTFSETSSAGAYNPSVGANFLWGSASTCTQATSSATASLQPGASCTVAIDFSPLSSTIAGSVSSSVTLTDNAYPTTQTIGLNGTVASALTATQAIASEVLTYNTAASFTPVTGLGGTGTLTYSVSPALPSGLSFNTSTGAIGDTPMTASSATTYYVTVTDAVGFSNSNSFLLTVNPASQTLSFTSGTVPTSAAYNATFTPAATSTSGLAAAITVSGGCSISSGVVTMTSGTTACVVKADQSGNSNYNAATEIMQSVTASTINQTLSFSTGTVPASSAYNATFTPAATATSGLAAAITVSGGCSISAGVVTMTSGTTACVVKADQAGNNNYNAATEISQTVTASTINQTLSFTSGTVPASAAFNSTFSPAATSTSGLAATITVSGGCSISSGVVTMTSGTTACAVMADQAGNTNYSAATEIRQTATAMLANQTLSFTSGTVPASAAYNATFTPGATSTSGLTAAITVSGGCSISAGVVTMTSGTTACVVKADQAGNGNYGAAAEITQSVTASLASQATLTVTGLPTAAQAYGTTFTVGTSGGSGTGTVSFTASGACSVNSTSGLVTMTSGTGSCSVYATKASDSNYRSATSATVSVNAALAMPTISWSTPTAITYGTALSTTQLDAALSVAGSCTYSPGAGIVLQAGTQKLTANCTPTNTTDYCTPPPASVSLTVTPETTTTILNTPTPVSALSNTVTLTATVSASYGVPTGSVSFYDGSTLLGAAGVNTSGVATFYVSSLATGAHSITASYGGDTNNSTSATSGALSETVVDFTITSNGSTAQTVMPGAAGTYTYNLTLTSGMTLPVAATVTLSGLPTGATASLTGAGWTELTGNSWQLPANTAVGAVTLSITAPSTTANHRNDPSTGRKAAPFALGLLLLPFVGRLRRAGKRLGRRGMLLLMFITSALVTVGMSGCGGSFFAQSQQSYNVTITVTAGSLTHASNVTLTVE
jgi:sugar lactone lactonase YvrE